MKLNYITLFFAISIIGAATEAVAQENRRVEVTTTYIPEVSPTNKLLAPTTIEDQTNIEPELEYHISPEMWQIDLESHTYKPAVASYWDFNRSKQAYVRLGGGYPLTTTGIVRYTLQNMRVGYIGVGINHSGDFAQRTNGNGVERFMANSYAMNNRVDLFGGLFAGRYMFEAKLNYDNDIFNRYAQLTENAPRLIFHKAGGEVRFGDNFANLKHLNFGVSLHGDYLAYRQPLMTGEARSAQEYNIGGEARIAREFRQNRVDISVGYETWRQGAKGVYRDNRFVLGVDYARKFAIVDVEAGLAYMYDRVALRSKASHFIMPRVKVLVDLNKVAFVPFVELNTTVSQNGISSLYKQNPYIDFEAMQHTLDAMPNTRSYNLSLGFSGTAASSRIAYRAYVGANFMRNQLLWYVTSPGLFGVDTINNNRLFVGIEAEARPVGGLIIGVSFYAHADNEKSVYTPSDSRMKACLNVEYTHRRWRVYAEADVIGKRVWSQMTTTNESNIAMSVPTKVDLKVGVSYRASQRVEIYANGLNLLNSNIYDFAYYYRNGIGFDAGIKLNF